MHKNTMPGKTGPPNTNNRKQWWAPVWTGLVVDSEAKHFKKIKNAVWLYLYLLLNAKRNSGFLMRKIKTISKDMGIKAIARRKGVKIAAFSPSTVKKFICGNGWADKKDVAKAIVSIFPELKVYLTQDRAWKEKFHQNMFDAVALAVIALNCK